ncbi:hypothetical protein NFI96_013476, partial [Prochilodus magdalenae]
QYFYEIQLNSFIISGWGNEITWVQTYEEGLSKMKASKKPLMVIHHLEECPHSQALKKAFAENKDIQRMAKSDFIMLNIMHETTDKNLSPDGYYVPRILFVDPSMIVRNDITGKYYNRKYAYEPDDMDFLMENMIKAKILLKTEQSTERRAEQSTERRAEQSMEQGAGRSMEQGAKEDGFAQSMEQLFRNSEDQCSFSVQNGCHDAPSHKPDSSFFP